MNANVSEPQGRWWLCWSFRQACSYIETEADGVRANLEAFADDCPVDYVTIGVFKSLDEARATADRLRAVMLERNEALQKGAA